MNKLKIILGILFLIAGTLTLLIHTRGLKKQYDAAVLRADAANPAVNGKIGDADIAHLPAAVKKYLQITGFAGGNKIRNFRLVWDGTLRSDAKSTWMPVVDLSGETLTTAETVTLFNDMCLMAPGALIDSRITWKELDAKSVEATFTNGKYKIKAQLQFNEQGELSNFISEDRYYLTPENTLRREKWSTLLTTTRMLPESIWPRGAKRFGT